MESKNFDMLLAGVGGQGIIFAGQIILESALSEGYRVYAFEEHGMARRGGAVASHIRFGEELYTPLIPVGTGKLLAAFEPAEALRHMHFMDSGSKIILNTKPVVPVSVSTGKGSYPEVNDIIDIIINYSREIYALNATSLAEQAGNPISMNAVMIGAISACGAVPLPKEIVLEIVQKRSPSYSKDINTRAFELGYDMVEDAK
ncbi:MAG: indolepyruvate oxidoreductase subunit beta [Thermoplasmata archaeon]|nr:MAG: indolepyruvate oxidoreductase subunit beta [Thermoplasmata archaeon]